MTPKQPNILIFMTDQEQGAVSAAEHPCITPHAERFAQQGIQFANSFCPTAHCCPSRVTFMTGMYPSRHGVYNNVLNPSAINRHINVGITTFSDQLAANGYSLAYSGKWHLSAMQNPEDRCWEEIEVGAPRDGSHHRTFDDYEAMSADEPRRWGQVERPGWGNFTLFDSYTSDTPKGYENSNDYRIVSKGIGVIERLAADDSPWCVFIGPDGPHDPYIPERRFVDMYDLDEIPLPASSDDDLNDKPSVYRRMREQFWNQLDDDEQRDAIRHYWAYRTMQDQMFGEVLAGLEATGQADDTIVLRLSDHGDYAGAHGIFVKGVPSFSEAYDVVSIARFPNGINDPRRIEARYITLADFAPTILELAGADADETHSGNSLVPLLNGEAVDWDDHFYSKMNGVELCYTQRIVANATYKYVYSGFDFDELYDLTIDPHERRNVAANPAYDDIKRELVRRMWTFARQENDELILNDYGTVTFAPWGPPMRFDLRQAAKEQADGHLRTRPADSVTAVERRSELVRQIPREGRALVVDARRQVPACSRSHRDVR